MCSFICKHAYPGNCNTKSGSVLGQYLSVPDSFFLLFRRPVAIRAVLLWWGFTSNEADC